MDYFLGGSLGGLFAFLFSIPAIVFEWLEKESADQAPLVIQVKTIFGKTLKKREVFLTGLLLHVCIGFLFGFVYILFVEKGWLFVTHRPFSFSSFFVYGCLSWVFTGLVLYPLMRMGWFGKKEGSHVWMETLVTHLLLGLCLWLSVQYFQPIYFVTP